MSAILWCLAFLLAGGSVLASDPLKEGFYDASCPSAEATVRSVVGTAFAKDRGVAAGLIRLHFHDCFVRGCDGSVLLDSSPTNTGAAEKSARLNIGLRGFEVIDDAKARLEKECPGTVSCADLLAFAARDSVALYGGLHYGVPAGRRDGTVSLASEVSGNVPDQRLELDALTDIFSKKGLTRDDLVVLSGAHSVGRAHCSSFSDRAYNFNGTGLPDINLNKTFIPHLRKLCPPPGPQQTDPMVPMNPESPFSLDTSYYGDVVLNKGLFTSDWALRLSPATEEELHRLAANGTLWAARFARAMGKMGGIEVLSGAAGEVRRECRRVNSKS